MQQFDPVKAGLPVGDDDLLKPVPKKSIVLLMAPNKIDRKIWKHIYQNNLLWNQLPKEMYKYIQSFLLEECVMEFYEL